jgi:hypothetical protein
MLSQEDSAKDSIKKYIFCLPWFHIGVLNIGVVEIIIF